MTQLVCYSQNMKLHYYSPLNFSECRYNYSAVNRLGFHRDVSTKIGTRHIFGGFCRSWKSKMQSLCIGCPTLAKHRASVKNMRKTFISNVYNADREIYNEKGYRRLGQCLVISPSNGRKPQAIIKFLGGAFIGAIPEVTYSHLIDLLAKEGFLIIAVPYNVTFDHEEAAKEVYDKFNACMDMLLSSGLSHAGLLVDDILQLPVYSVGHSNGALLQLLAGSYFGEKIPKANAIISFNNKEASEAVPYFEQLGPVATQLAPILEASPVYAMARNTSDNAFKTVLDVAGPMLQQFDQEAIGSVTKFIDQLPSVMSQVNQGVSEFKPTPLENRDFIKCSYNVRRTLLVKFNFDAIDETDVIEEILKPRIAAIGGKLEKVTLNGIHITPCAQDIKWKVGDLYTPADALAQGLKAASLNDTRILVRTISDWFKNLGEP
ncbi:hypothetical protein AMTRI_Chr12g234370 [Amborella trichopoda]